jgi:hypothetical protein
MPQVHDHHRTTSAEGLQNGDRLVQRLRAAWEIVAAKTRSTWYMQRGSRSLLVHRSIIQTVAVSAADVNIFHQAGMKLVLHAAGVNDACHKSPPRCAFTRATP